MLAQQGLLRSVAFRRWYGFPDEWPLPPDKLAEQARKRGVTVFANMAPLFRRFSALGDGDFARAWSGAPAVPQLVYMTHWGLRDPGAPPPPPDDSPAAAAAAAPAAAVPTSAKGAAPAPHLSAAPPRRRAA